MKTPTFYTKVPPYVAPPALPDTLRQLWEFALRPKVVPREQNIVETKLPLIFQITFIEMAIQTALLVGLAFLYDTLGFEYLITTSKDTLASAFPFFPLLVTVVLLAPLTEEIIFRLPLVYSRGFLFVAVFALLLNFGPLVMQTLEASMVYFAGGALLLLALAVWPFISRRLQAIVYLFWKRHFGFVFYTSAGLFALLHLLNYQETGLPLALLLLLVLPKFVGGIFLGYTRLRLGVGWSVALHMFNNLVALMLLYGMMG
ncbi:CPBP family glutamic-type intramembrane protease [Pontibacter anaerobius]|uniref:CAAX prenyl protease 2/Lysostaphin resistance protein A-like domain-containing protein n=1 Tax=Pontibacter anaerobius TaxID=2993940 RepID=A0ABT3RJH2_9BACT|nr:CPBP family glutamic-type intramembrane protease [Pontibacter anaerobius]MCX2741648.1 hypothetical protein [Pontibacter anaerobius]